MEPLSYTASLALDAKVLSQGPEMLGSGPSKADQKKERRIKLFRRRASVVWHSHQPHPDLQRVTTH